MPPFCPLIYVTLAAGPAASVAHTHTHTSVRFHFWRLVAVDHVRVVYVSARMLEEQLLVVVPVFLDSQLCRTEPGTQCEV
jgi:hypothetical protein